MCHSRSSNYVQIILTFYSLHNIVQKLNQTFCYLGTNNTILFLSLIMHVAGENVTICYVDPSFDAMRRRNELLINFIECQCKRCKDPTEFGTMYNTVKCIKK